MKTTIPIIRNPPCRNPEKALKSMGGGTTVP
jgi:hypothetical protein